MPISRPRRIFRSYGLPRPDIRVVAVVVLALLTVAGGVSLAMLPRASPSSQPPPEAAAELRARPAEVAVVDGGTLRLRDSVVRLQGVAPPPRGTSCEAGDCGAAATNALAALVREVAVACKITGTDGMGRPFAVCQAGGTELNRAVVAAGWARADGRQPALKRAEDAARAERRGVWARDPS